MKLLWLQILIAVIALTGTTFLIFKKKVGWVFGMASLLCIILLNYLVDLYVLIIPCTVSLVFNIVGYAKWRKEKKDE